MEVKTALLVAYGGGHVPMIAPVMRELEARGIACTAMALTTGYRKACQLGLKPLGYRDFAHLVPERERVLAWGRALLDGNSHPDVDEEESLWYLGVNYAQWVRELGEAGAAKRYAERGRTGFHPLEFMTAVVRQLAPDIVVVTNSPRTEAAATEAAVCLGIPSLSMTDLFVDATDPYCYRPVHADRITVLSPAVKQAMVEAGMAAQRLVVTGNPAFDTLRAPEVIRQARVLRESLGWMQQRVILFAGHREERPRTPPEWQNQGFGTEVQEWLHRWVQSHADDALVTRYHPSEWHLYPTLPPGPRLHCSAPSVEPLHPLLLASDIVVVQTSTVGLEAALAGKRTICLKFAPSVREASYNYADLGLAEGVDSWAELHAALACPRSAPLVDPSAFCVGSSAERVAKLVIELGRRGPGASAE